MGRCRHRDQQVAQRLNQVVLSHQAPCRIKFYSGLFLSLLFSFTEFFQIKNCRLDKTDIDMLLYYQKLNIQSNKKGELKMTAETLSSGIKIFALVVSVFSIALAVSPKEIPRIGLVVWAKNAHWEYRVLLALLGILLGLGVLEFS